MSVNWRPLSDRQQLLLQIQTKIIINTVICVYFGAKLDSLRSIMYLIKLKDSRTNKFKLIYGREKPCQIMEILLKDYLLGV